MDSFCEERGIELRDTSSYGRGLFVSTNPINAGTVIWTEPALTYALSSNVCHFCWRKSSAECNLSRCSNCKFARYCSQKCQSKDWKQSHKQRCKAISKLSKQKRIIPTKTVLAIAELLCQIQPYSNKKYSNLRNIQHSLLPLLKHHFDKKTENEKYEMTQVSLCILLYIKSLNKSMNGINMDKINVLLSKFSTNAISIYDDEFNAFGIGLFPILSMLNHSCCPNVFVKFDPYSKTAQIRALRKIQQNEQLFISYTDITAPKQMRQQSLSKSYYFLCQCSFCQNFDESMCGEINCKKEKMQKSVDEYYEMKQQMNKKYDDDEKEKLLLTQCKECLFRIDGIVGKYHWLRIGFTKIMEKLQMNLGLFEECYLSNCVILEFYEIWLDEYSPYLGIQCCLTGKLLNYLIHRKMDKMYANGGIKGKEVYNLCVQACKLFEKGLKILIISHGECPFVKAALECHQTAQFNLQNISKLGDIKK